MENKQDNDNIGATTNRGSEIDAQILTKINIVTLLIGLAGFFVSLYALAVHLQVTLKQGGSPICDFTSTVNCSAVIGSSYGELASIPLGAYGMAYFAIIISAATMPKIAQITRKWLAFWELIIAVAGVFSVGALIYISYFVLNTVCPTCTIIHVLIGIYAVLKVIQFIKAKNDKNISKNDAFTRFMAVSLCLGIPPLAIGLFAPIIAPYFLPAKEKAVALQPPSNTTQSTVANKSDELDIKQQMMSFNKTNFVGNGEDYRRGDDNAKVIVQIFSDFGCPHCHTATEAILKAQDVVGLDKVLFVYRFFPLSNKCNSLVPSEGYPYSCSLAEAARCAGQQGKFWEFKSWAFSGQNWNNAERAQNFSLDGMKRKATELGLNSDAFAQCLQSDMELAKIKDDAFIANKMNIQGTPLIIINGEQYDGNHSSEAFTQAFYQAMGKIN